jgi:hypothetical protein
MIHYVLLGNVEYKKPGVLILIQLQTGPILERHSKETLEKNKRELNDL